MDDMTPERRELYLSIFDGYNPPHDLLNRLHFLDDHFPPRKLDRALAWLVRGQLTGATFMNWYNVVCKKSDLEMLRVLVAVVDNQRQGALIAGENFRL